MFNSDLYKKYLIENRRYFHMYPELSGEEYNTSNKICEELEKLNIEYYRLEYSQTSICAEIKGSGDKYCDKSVLLRADIDALPIQEKTSHAFSSKNDGIMHACGHDAHTAMLLCAAKILSENKDKLNGNVRLIFEAGEEVGAFGKKISESEVLKDIASVFAIHVQEGIPSGKVSIQSGVRMAGAGFFKVVVHGEGGHGSSPDKGIDVIPAAAAMVMNLQTLVSREISPLDSCVVSVGTFNAGTKANIIADTAEFTGSLRFYNKKVQEYLPSAFKRIIENTALAYRTSVDIMVGCGMPPIYNDMDCSEIAKKALITLGCESSIYENQPSTGSDDFCYYLEKVPGIYAFLGVGKSANKKIYPAHNALFDIEEDPLYLGAKLYVQYAVTFLEEARNE